MYLHFTVCVREYGNLGLLGLFVPNLVEEVPELAKGIYINIYSLYIHVGFCSLLELAQMGSAQILEEV